jgi:hypothetical protein
MRFLPSSRIHAGSIVLPVFVLACSSPPTTGNDAGPSGPISFKNDILPGFELSCGLSSACHQDPTQMRGGHTQIFLGCKMSSSSSCSVADPGPQVYPALKGNSVEDPTMPYVTPNDPNNSFLLHKMDGDQANLNSQCLPVNNDSFVTTASSEPMPFQPCGTSMPLGQPANTDLNAKVRAWIMQGAPDN